jgi:hypothetical protein
MSMVCRYVKKKPYFNFPNNLIAGGCMLIHYLCYCLFVKGSYHSWCMKRILEQVLLVDDSIEDFLCLCVKVFELS